MLKRLSRASIDELREALKHTEVNIKGAQWLNQRQKTAVFHLCIQKWHETPLWKHDRPNVGHFGADVLQNCGNNMSDVQTHIWVGVILLHSDQILLSMPGSRWSHKMSSPFLLAWVNFSDKSLQHSNISLLRSLLRLPLFLKIKVEWFLDVHPNNQTFSIIILSLCLFPSVNGDFACS